VLLAHGGDDQIVLYVDSAPGRSAVGPNAKYGAGLKRSAYRGRPECAGRPARSRWCKSITMKE
jgi:hypothetical protein